MQTLLIIGGTGSLGNHLVKRLQNTYKIIILSRDENKQWSMRQLFPFLTFVLCDIRNKENFERILLTLRPDRIIIAAALKHIDQCERNIDECITTNILGVSNVIHSITENLSRNLLTNLNTVAFISTDKAASPVNVYGMCKSICERLMAEKSLLYSTPKFVCVRYGNVLNSRGSLFPLFKELANNPNKDCFPVTDDKMTRFFLHLDQSIDLIVKAMDYGESGDTFIPRVPSYRILDIAQCFSELYDKPVKVVGIRPGEKMHECLINESERNRTIQKDDVYIIKPCYNNFDSFVDFEKEYTSETEICDDKNKIRKIICEI